MGAKHLCEADATVQVCQIGDWHPSRARRLLRLRLLPGLLGRGILRLLKRLLLRMVRSTWQLPHFQVGKRLSHESRTGHESHRCSSVSHLQATCTEVLVRGFVQDKFLSSFAKVLQR